MYQVDIYILYHVTLIHKHLLLSFHYTRLVSREDRNTYYVVTVAEDRLPREKVINVDGLHFVPDTYTHTYVYIYCIRTHIYIYIYIYIPPYIYTVFRTWYITQYTRIYICLYLYSYIYICLYIYMFIHVFLIIQHYSYIPLIYINTHTYHTYMCHLHFVPPHIIIKYNNIHIIITVHPRLHVQAEAPT